MNFLRSKHNVPTKPTFSRFVIALFLVKSKPANLSVQEYLLSLRSYIIEGCRLEGSTTVQAYVDTSAFWRDAYKKSEQAQVQLRAKIFELERMQGTRQDQADGISTNEASQGKRKRLEIEAGGVVSEHPLKKPRAMTDGPSLLAEMMKHDIASSISGQDANAFVLRFYHLQQLSSQKHPDCKSLTLVLSQICLDIRQIVFSVKSSQIPDITATIGRCKATTTAQRQDFVHSQADIDHNLTTKLIAIGRIFPFLLKAVHKLSQTDQEESFEAQVIYYFVKLFQDILQHICALLVPQTKANEQSKSSQKRKKNSQAKPKIDPLPKTSQGPIIRLCHLLNNLMTSFDTNNTTDKEILEGFLFFLLHHVGTMLKIFVFGDDANNIIASKLIPRIPIFPSQGYQEERRIAEAQAPYLIPILAHAVRIATHHLSPLTIPPHVSTNSPIITTIPSHTRPTSTSLQSTLLTALFGPTFSDALLPPTPPNTNPETENELQPSRDEGGVADWFKSEVWRIVGWDVLADCIVWE